MASMYQRVMIIQDASGKLNIQAMKRALNSLRLKPRDTIRLLGVVTLRIDNSPAFMVCGTLIGPKGILYPSAAVRKKREDIELEIARKEEELHNNAEIKKIINLADSQQVVFEIKVEIGELKSVAIEAATDFNATCLILDKKMKKDVKFFQEKFSCGIVRMRRDNSVEYVRVPKAAETGKTTAERGQSNHSNSEASREPPDEMFQISAECPVCMNKRPRIGSIREFTYPELQFATNGFSPENLLSRKGKDIYRGKLTNQTTIVIRKHPSATIKEDAFKSQVQVTGNARHDNVAMLLGSCSSGNHRLLVYEYVCNGSLNTYLSSNSKALTWENRMKIAAGAARGLEYLHSRNIHGHMRPSNILLTHDHKPLLANFGVATNQYEGLDHSFESSARKTFEYLAPEYEETGVDLSKADVYSFGVVLLELITGRKTIKDTNGESYLRWARPLLQQKRYADIIDPTLMDSHDIHQLFWMVRVAERCICSNLDKRLSIDKVATVLTAIMEGGPIKFFSPTEYELTAFAH